MGVNGYEAVLKAVHDQRGWHEALVRASKVCGCFSCLAIFPVGEIVDWIDEPDDCPRGPGRTAECPRCGIDCVLPDAMRGRTSSHRTC